MSRRGKHLEIVSLDEIQRAFERPPWNKYGPIITPGQLAEIVGRSRSTIYHWLRLGRLDGTFRSRGKGHLLWRNKAIEKILNGPNWAGNGEKDHEEDPSKRPRAHPGR